MATPNVLDMFHGDGRAAVPDFEALRVNGILGVVHRCSVGAKFADTLHDARKTAALDAGLLWGSYHLLTSDDAAVQAKRFLDLAAFDENAMPVCFYQNSFAAPALHQCIDFVQYVDDETPGVLSCVIASGDHIRQTLRPTSGGASSNSARAPAQFFAQRRLWLQEFGPHSNIPYPWNDAELSLIWQNPFMWRCQPKGRSNPVLGTSNLSTYLGDADALKANWSTLTTASAAT